MSLKSMNAIMRELSSPEALTRSYKEMFDGISDDEAAALASAFRLGICDSKAIPAFKKQLAAAKRKYKQRDLTPDIIEWELPEISIDL